MLKKIFTGVVLLMCLWFCSEQEYEYASTGKIMGIDDRECGCCCGYFIEIADSTYRFYNIPPGSRLNLENPDFPVYVKLDWHEDPNACLGDEIIVTRIEKR